MNFIQIVNRIDFYNDLTRSARVERINYDNAVRDAVRMFVDSLLKQGAFQATQFVHDDLSTLITTQTAVPTLDVALEPANYLYFTSLSCTISGTSYYCRPTTQNELGPLLTDSYRAPSDTKPYYLQQSTGFKILHGAGTITSATLTYLRKPATFSCGKESSFVTTTLTNGVPYYAVEESVYNGVTYSIGDSISGTGAALTSGTVIAAASGVDLDLPARTHDKICRMASEIIMGTQQSYNQSAFSEKEANKG